MSDLEKIMKLASPVPIKASPKLERMFNELAALLETELTGALVSGMSETDANANILRAFIQLAVISFTERTRDIQASIQGPAMALGSLIASAAQPEFFDVVLERGVRAVVEVAEGERDLHDRFAAEDEHGGLH